MSSLSPENQHSNLPPDLTALVLTLFDVGGVDSMTAEKGAKKTHTRRARVVARDGSIKKKLNPFFHSVVKYKTIGCFKETIGCFSAAVKQILNFNHEQKGFKTDVFDLVFDLLKEIFKHEYKFKKELKIEIRKVLSFMMFLQ